MFLIDDFQTKVQELELIFKNQLGLSQPKKYHTVKHPKRNQWGNLIHTEQRYRVKKNEKDDKDSSCITFIILYRLDSNIKRAFRKTFLNLLFLKVKHTKMMVSDLRRVVKNGEHLRVHDRKAEHHFSSQSNYAGSHPITDIMWS